MPARTLRTNSRLSHVRGWSRTKSASCAENRWRLSPSKIEILVIKSKKTIAFAERLQFMILEAEIEELLTVATSFVRAKRNVVLKRLMSAIRADAAMRSGRMIDPTHVSMSASLPSTNQLYVDPGLSVASGGRTIMRSPRSNGLETNHGLAREVTPTPSKFFTIGKHRRTVGP
jgi:hypothetical protein